MSEKLPIENSPLQRANESFEEVPLSFEEALQRWEEVVGLLERGSLTLEESLRLYEEGMNLRARCYARLREAEGKMKVLRQAAEDAAAEEEPAG